MKESPPIKRWTRHEYDGLVECGAFGPADRIELLAGARVVREPQGAAHAMGVRGWRYTSVVVLGLADTISPLAGAASIVPVVDLIP